MNVFAIICGQTSPVFLGHQSPLCYRCMGICLAFAGGLACGVLARRSVAPSLKLFLTHLALALAALLFLAGDVFFMQARCPNDAMRFLTGTGAGWGLALLLADGVAALSTRPA